MEDVTICPVIVFNQAYESNIPKLKKLYDKRFSDIYYLMPDYKGKDPHIIQVNGQSSQFHGYLYQGFEKFYDSKYSHYVFWADDLILRDDINQDNLTDKLTINHDSGYIKSVFPLHSLRKPWSRLFHAMVKILDHSTEVSQRLPDFNEAVQCFRRHGIIMDNCIVDEETFDMVEDSEYKKLVKYIDRDILKLNFPLVGGYSDFVVVPKDAIMDFFRYCSIFASIGLFVEVALPTALLLACENVCFEQEHAQGLEFWYEAGLSTSRAIHPFSTYQINDNTTLKDFSEECQFQVKNIFKKYPSFIYVHPIKLSKWEV